MFFLGFFTDFELDIIYEAEFGLIAVIYRSFRFTVLLAHFIHNYLIPTQ